MASFFSLRERKLGSLKLDEMFTAAPLRMERTWFWIRSLTRSMGAAAVFETAAETPPTVSHRQHCMSRACA